jgi:hypothetical protein
MNREPTKSSPDRNDGKMGRRSLLGMRHLGGVSPQGTVPFPYAAALFDVCEQQVEM